MPVLREVFEMTTKQMGEPDVGSWGEQEQRQRRTSRNKRLGTLAVAAISLAILLIMSSPFDRSRTPAATGPTGPAELTGGYPDKDYVIDLNTAEMTPLPGAIIRSVGGVYEHPHEPGVFLSIEGQYAVSPDASLLAYVGIAGEGNPQIFIAGIDGTGIRQVTHAPNGAGGSPAWSPDGTTIVYEGAGSDRVHGLSLLDVASGESTQIVVGEREGPVGQQPAPMEPQFTSNGSSVLYSSLRDSSAAHRMRYTDLQTVPVAGGENTLLIRPPTSIRDTGNGSLSPDGSLVTFLGSEIGRRRTQRWVANADGTGQRLLPEVYGIPCRSNPAGTWSPDGSRIVCAEANRIIVIDIASGQATSVAPGREAIWLDDHTLLVSV
jgi:Tol biopolymer transport system component